MFGFVPFLCHPFPGLAFRPIPLTFCVPLRPEINPVDVPGACATNLVLDTRTRAQDVKAISATQLKAARVSAVSADALQLFFFPLFAAGFGSVLDDSLDVLVCAVLTMLVGWHYSFLPSFVVKVVLLWIWFPPGRIAVFLATRKTGRLRKLLKPRFTPIRLRHPCSNRLRKNNWSEAPSSE